MKRKIRQPGPGQPKPSLTKLKELPLAERCIIMDILRGKTYLEASPLVGELVGFPCSPKVLLRFYHWQETQDSLENSEDLLQQVIAFEKESHPHWPVEKARAVATTFFMRHAVEKKDLKEFASVARLTLQNEKGERDGERLELQKSKFDESQRTKMEAGLDAIADAFGKNPEALRLYQQARNMLDDKQPTSNPQ